MIYINRLVEEDIQQINNMQRDDKVKASAEATTNKERKTATYR
jgi:hypothetical protein